MAADASNAQQRANDALWSRRGLVKRYRTSDLRPPEARILERHRDALGGAVLELGSGAGRLTGHLARIADSVTATDISQAMLDATAAQAPGTETVLLDLRDLDRLETGRFGAVVAAYNIIDILDDTERRQALTQIHRLLEPDGILVFSSHNRRAAHRIEEPMRLRGKDPLRAAVTLARLPRWKRNRRRLLPLERQEHDYAILNDLAEDYMSLHYYIDRDTQEHQLAEQRFELVEVLDLAGEVVEPGADSAESSDLHYVARRSG